MKENQSDPIEKFVQGMVGILTAKFAEFDQTIEPEVMTKILVEYCASAAFWTPAVKEQFSLLILPMVQERYRRGS
jgi:hypothetical protein